MLDFSEKWCIGRRSGGNARGERFESVPGRLLVGRV